MSIYDYTLKKSDCSEYSLAVNKGKVMIIVNTATRCGFTPQYKELEEMYEKYRDKGLEIIDIPCNQFANQAPESDEEITQFCSLKYKTKFPQMKKSEVNGDNELTLYTYLKEKAPVNKGFKVKMLGILSRSAKKPTDVKWNFTKFVIDRDGNIVARFEPTADMADVEKCVISLL